MKKTLMKHFYLIPLLVILIPSIGYGKTLFSQSSIVRQQCSACHKPDTNGVIEVIEETRKTPEEWNAVINRMIRLNSAPVDESMFYPLIKELAQYL